MVTAPALRFDPDLHQYWLGDVRLPSVTEIIDSHELISPWAKDEEAARRGAYVHIAARYLFEGRLDWSTCHETIRPYLLSLWKWIESSQFEAKHCERMAYHPVLLYAGTWDVDGTIPGKGNYLIDIKSGQQCSRWHRLQLAGYQAMIDGYRKRGCLHVQRDGSPAKFYAHNDSSDRLVWQALVTVYREKEMA